MKMKNFTFTIVLLILVNHLLLSQITSYFPENSITSVVLLEKKIGDNYIPHGTGFLLQSYDTEQPIIVVTNEHVLRNSSIYITVPADTDLITYMNGRKSKVVCFKNTCWDLFGNKLRHKFKLIKDSTFVCNKELDIAAFKLNIGSWTNMSDNSQMNISPILGLGKELIRYKKDVSLGTNIFFVGFPFAIGTESGFYNTKAFSDYIPNPLVRNGSVAWISNTDNVFLLDAFSYSGNSGSPVFTSTDSHNRTYLIGIVSGHLPSSQSENIGLARCIWSDEIMKLISRFK